MVSTVDEGTLRGGARLSAFLWHLRARRLHPNPQVRRWSQSQGSGFRVCLGFRTYGLGFKA